MPEISVSSRELNGVSRHTTQLLQTLRTGEAAEARDAQSARDRVTRNEQPSRRSKLPSLKSIANAVISVGVGAGAYRFGEFVHANLHRDRQVTPFRTAPSRTLRA